MATETYLIDRDDDQGPEDQGKAAKRDSAVEHLSAVYPQNRLQCVKRTCADVAEHDAQRGKRHRSNAARNGRGNSLRCRNELARRGHH